MTPEPVIRTTLKSLKKPVFLAGNANWIGEISSVRNKYNNTVQQSTKLTPNETSKNLKERVTFDTLQNRSRKHIPKNKVGGLVRTSDFRSIFSEGDSSNYRYNFYTLTEVMYETFISYRRNYPHK